jgi:hypothetical protein
METSMRTLLASLVGWATVFVLMTTGCDSAKDGDEESDASSALHERKDSGSPDSQACNLACVRGKHCVVSASGPSCVADAEEPVADAGSSTNSDAGTNHELDAGHSLDAGSTTSADAGAGSPTHACAATTCPVDTYCDDITGTAKCISSPSCNTVKCAAGTMCQLVTVQCIRAPCPAQPQCVPSTSSGSDGGVACGKHTCATGQRCCSASCGICGSAGGACPAIACVPDTQN